MLARFGVVLTHLLHRGRANLHAIALAETVGQLLQIVAQELLVEFNGEHDHVHLLINYPPKVALSNLVASLKGVSSRMLRKEFGDFHPWLKRRGVLWSPSYFASSCGGAPIDVLGRYIEEQQTPH